MKKIITVLVLLLTIAGYSQVGINTTSPTSDLDVDGTFRVRNLTEGSVVSDANGNVSTSPIRVVATGKVIAGTTVTYTASGATVTRNGEGDYTVHLGTPLASADYTIVLTVKSCNGQCPGVSKKYDAPSATYYNQTTSSFDIHVGDNDNGNTQSIDIDQEFMFVVYSF